MEADFDFPFITTTIDSLRAHFQQIPNHTAPLFNPDYLSRHSAYSNELKPSAVLIPILAHTPSTLTILFTQRSEQLTNHPGQISFPGGRHEAGDADLISTALRESFEEIALPSERIEVLGCLNHYITSTGYHVTPVVGLIHSVFEPVPSSHEVLSTLEIPLAFAMNPENYSLEQQDEAGLTRTFYQLNHPSHHIWGATAAMLFGLYETLLASHGSLQKPSF